MGNQRDQQLEHAREYCAEIKSYIDKVSACEETIRMLQDKPDIAVSGKYGTIKLRDELTIDRNILNSIGQYIIQGIEIQEDRFRAQLDKLIAGVVDTDMVEAAPKVYGGIDPDSVLED